LGGSVGRQLYQAADCRIDTARAGSCVCAGSHAHSDSEHHAGSCPGDCADAHSNRHTGSRAGARTDANLNLDVEWRTGNIQYRGVFRNDLRKRRVRWSVDNIHDVGNGCVVAGASADDFDTHHDDVPFNTGSTGSNLVDLHDESIRTENAAPGTDQKAGIY
jgi:hypothetical protein